MRVSKSCKSCKGAWEVSIAPIKKVKVTQQCVSLLPNDGGLVKRLPCTAMMDGDVNSPVVFEVPRNVTHAMPAFIYDIPGKPKTYKAMWLYLHPAHDDALHKRLHTFEVQCQPKPGGAWTTVLKVKAPKARKHRKSGAPMAHTGCAGGQCNAWVQYKFDTTTCSSQKWRLTKMNGEDPGKQIYVFELKFTTHQRSVSQCAKGKALTYTHEEAPCLPRRKPSRIQGYCVFNQRVKMDGAEHCFSDSPKGYPNWMKEMSKMPAPAALNSFACFKNDITQADWSGGKGTTMPVVKAPVAETYVEEIVFPLRGVGGSAFYYRMTSDKGAVYAGQKVVTSSTCSAVKKKALVKKFSPYPNTCRYLLGGCTYDSGVFPRCSRHGLRAMGSWTAKGQRHIQSHQSSQCCPFRHIYSPMQPVDVPKLRATTSLDIQFGEHMGMRGDGAGAYNFRAACLTAQGNLYLTWWYKPENKKDECRLPGLA